MKENVTVNTMSVTSSQNSVDEAAYNTRTAFDQAQEYAKLVANFAQMKYMHDGGDAEEQYLESLVDEESLPFDDTYDPDQLAGWIEEPHVKEDVLTLYRDAVEEYLEDRGEDLKDALKKAKHAKSRADAKDELEIDDNRHYEPQDVDPSTIGPELEKAETLVAETDSYTSRVFGEQVKNRPTTLAKRSSFNSFSPSEM